eukprot:CAMPEP_0202978892 /NCGR_PEP_ID=MMETSP1396-20130829/85191_1 /ASSEMBLY_ACC=CAM_ASM_000872 /TAXON_ID= /ORGANISM="Pseudokeronopsis sp., Strain Brazil" /LENGTH=283 /DNA_ID=CAMNT_0049718065 /DNA_START=9 /DNA_END=860 /DNA_ORIENTATION=+
MATICSHQDQSRSRVSSTALLIAYARSLESDRDKDDRLFVDPFALSLAGDLGKSSIALAGESEEDWSSKKKSAFLQAIATRTKVIDDFVLECINNKGIQQVIVLGAGLDTRPWRLQPTTRSTVKYFEIDFPETFDYKLSILRDLAAVPRTPFEYHNVVADLSLASVWPIQLAEAGLDPTRRSLWVMEGFCNYLTEEELTKLMNTVKEVTPYGSCLISTFLTPRSTHVSLKLHRFFPDDPLTFMSQFGWNGRQDDVEDLTTELGREPVGSTEEHRGYFIVRLQK